MGGDQLLTALHTNLWASLRHVFNTDRVLLAVTYAINFAGFVMLAFATSRRPLAAGITVAALPVLNGLIMLSFINSRREAESLLNTLIQLYQDHDLGRYFDESKLRYYSRRYSLWLILTPSVCVIAVALGVAVGW